MDVLRKSSGINSGQKMQWESEETKLSIGTKRKIIDHCKKLPCFNCIVRFFCFKGTDYGIENPCSSFASWLIKRNTLWTLWDENGTFDSLAHIFAIAKKEMEKKKNGRRKKMS